MDSNIDSKSRIKIMNLPNILTMFRTVIIPVFIICLLNQKFKSSIIAYFLFLIASITDYFDGYIARKYKISTELGAFLDPLSDKLLTGAAFIIFYFLKNIFVPLWMVIVIIFREILVTVFRIIAVKKDRPLKTEFAGKLKTAFQMFTINVILIYNIIYFYILNHTVYSANIGLELWKNIVNEKIANAILYLPAVLTFVCAIFSLISMILYIVKNRYLFRTYSEG